MNLGNPIALEITVTTLSRNEAEQSSYEASLANYASLDSFTDYSTFVVNKFIKETSISPKFPAVTMSTKELINLV